MKSVELNNIDKGMELFEECWKTQGALIIYPTEMNRIELFSQLEFTKVDTSMLKYSYKVSADYFSSSIDYIYELIELFEYKSEDPDSTDEELQLCEKYHNRLVQLLP